MVILNLKSLDDFPDEKHLPNDLEKRPIRKRKEFLENLASVVVDKYILQIDKVEDLLAKNKSGATGLLGKSSAAAEKADERFPCRHPGCKKSFKYDGKNRQQHEATHQACNEEGKKKFLETSDDMYNYQLALLDYGMVVKNFFEAISEGDGDRVLRNWKFMMLYLKVDGRRSSKYALECMYLLCQAQCLLSEQAAHRLI